MDKDQVTEFSLYRRMIGEHWTDLDDSVRSFVCTAGPRQFRGRLRIRRSANWIAALVARLLGLPRPSESVPGELVIVPERGGDIWRRTFGDRSFTTRQTAGPGGMLIERYGALEFSFALHVRNGALHFDQVEATIHLARFCMRIPGWMSPRVSAVCEGGAGPNLTHASVQIRAPLIGTVVAYDGDFEGQE